MPDRPIHHTDEIIRATPRFESKLELLDDVHKMLMYNDLKKADMILNQYFGPTHTIRIHLKEYMDRL